MVATRQEIFELGAHDRPVPHPAGGDAASGSRLAHTINVLQMLGAVLAIPVALGSAYSMYQTTFSPEAGCKALRANIVRMLDKNVDVSTRHMLVRRDVEAFEQQCDTVDPDATAAFKALLSADRVTPVAVVPLQAAWPHPVTRQADPAEQPQQAARKIEPPASAKPAPARESAALPVQRDTSAADAAWVAAVRSALVTREPETATAALGTSPTPVPPAPPQHVRTEPAAAVPLMPPPQVPLVAPITAPTLPPPAVIDAAPAAQITGDHPVPPAAIPDPPMQDIGKKRSRIGELVEDIPFFGKSLADRVWR